MLEYAKISKMFEAGQKINYDVVLQKVIQDWQRETK